MKINVHAGHNPDGKTACGAVGYIKESTEARKLKDKVIKYLEMDGHTVYDCTVNDGKNASDVLKKIVTKCNANKVDKDISIHFNAGSKDPDDKTTGCEVLIYKDNSEMCDEAKSICAKLEKIGFKNRGVKVRKDLYYLKRTKASSALIETCFVDDENDSELFLKNIDKIALAIAEGIVGHTIVTKKAETTITTKTEVKTTTSTVTATKTKTTAETKKDNIKAYQKWLNTNFGFKLKTDGSYGSETKKASIKAWQTIVNKTYKTKLTVDGVFGIKSYSVANKAVLKMGYESDLIYILQGVLNAKGYVCEVDGSYGSNTKSKVISFQKDKAITADGVVGKHSWNKLFA